MLQEQLDALCAELGVQHHGLRFRTTGYRVRVEVHLLFRFDAPVGEAHRIATQIEERLPERLPFPVEVTTHLESLEDHGSVHRDSDHAAHVR
jgi:divalent metal cation (Fe/Co/Zn/Cd) transporter